MTRQPYLFDVDSLIQARIEFVREARALPLGAERNQKRQIARSLKRLIAAPKLLVPSREQALAQ
jgi:hypothetical protein